MYKLEKAWIEKALISLGVELSTIEFKDLQNALRVYIGSKPMTFDQYMLDGLVQNDEYVGAEVVRRLKALVAPSASAAT